MKLKLKKIIAITMALSVVTLTGCFSKKEEDVPAVTTPTPEAPVVAPEPEPEPEPTYEDYFPQASLLGKTLEQIGDEFDYVEDEFEGNIRRYILDGIDVCDSHYDDVFVYANDSGVITKVEFDFFFGNLYGDLVDIQLQDATANLDAVNELLGTINAVDISGVNGNLLDIVEDYNSGKLLEGGDYSSTFDIDGHEVEISCLVNTFEVGMIIMKSISFELGE